jgi:hypothetical protein
VGRRRRNVARGLHAQALEQRGVGRLRPPRARVDGPSIPRGAERPALTGGAVAERGHRGRDARRGRRACRGVVRGRAEGDRVQGADHADAHGPVLRRASPALLSARPAHASP